MVDMIKQYADITETVEKAIGERPDIINRRGKVVTPRKYHMADGQTEKLANRWKAAISDVPTEIKNKASSIFFNPYRENGAYYGGVQALFLLGANEWHHYGDVRGMMQDDMSTRKSASNKMNSWEKFALRAARQGAASTKDLMGRIKDNFRTLQRLGGIHPYGYKLKQLQATVDIRREADGIWFFRLNTSWTSVDSVAPFYDISAYSEPRGRKVGGKVVTSGEVAV